ncbi:rac GTPase-activating protein 1-like [Amphiura filiformis]|uniref:rac GTPase-activating protein 1-like n=1 Tax=Amphiura filiformis TaxID=82378 RepID=UPI003B212981
MAGVPKKSTMGEFDELVHYTSILTKGDEQEFIKFVKSQVDCTKKWLTAELDKTQLQQQLTKMTAERAGLETKLKHARSQVDIEMKRRMKAEQKQEQLESQVNLIRELLNDKEKGTLSEKERESLAFLDRTTPVNADGTPTRRLSAIHESSGNLLDPSDLSYDYTEEDLDVSYLRDGKKWKGTGSTVKRRPSAPPLEDDDSPPKRSKMDTSTVVTTTVTVPNSGHVIAESKIETTPNVNMRSRKKSTRGHQHAGHFNGMDEDDDSFWGNPENQSLKAALFTTAPSSPVKTASQHCMDEDDDSFWGNPENQSLKAALFTTAPSSPVKTASSQNHRKHEFVTKTVIRPESCGPCGKKVKFGKYALKCRNCRAVCHPDCKETVPLPCIPVAGTPNRRPPNQLEDFVPSTAPQIPSLVIQCVEEIEARGMREEGLYRLSGSDKQVRELKEKMVMGKDVKLEKITDIHVICGVLKDFLRKIEEPIITFHLHEQFMNAAGVSDVSDSITAMYQAVSELPYPNRDTLAYVILHLQRVAENKECKMPKTNLAKVFGPTIVRHSCPDPEPLQMLNDTKLQPAVVDRLLSMPTDFWSAFININGENHAPAGTETPARHEKTPVLYAKIGGGHTTPYTPSNKRSSKYDSVLSTQDINSYNHYNTRSSIGKQKRSFRSKSKNVPSSMLGPVHTPGSVNSKMGKKTPSSTSVNSNKHKSIFSKTPLTPRFGSRSENRTKKTTNFFSSPTLR